HGVQIRVHVVPSDTVVGAGGSLEDLVMKDAFVASVKNRRGVDISGMTKEQRVDWALKNNALPVGATRMVSPKDAETPGEWTLREDDVGLLCGEITIREDAGGALYHEMFHAVMNFVKGVGALSNEDVKALQSRYGRSKDGKWFNEEGAADGYRKFVEEKIAPKETKGVFARLLQLIRTLYRVLFNADRAPSAYASEEFEDSPLAGIMLTGSVVRTVPQTVSMTGEEKIYEAVRTFRDFENTLSTGFQEDQLEDITTKPLPSDPAISDGVGPLDLSYFRSPRYVASALADLSKPGRKTDAATMGEDDVFYPVAPSDADLKFAEALLEVARNADAASPADRGRIRKEGSDRLKSMEKGPGLLAALKKLMDQFGPRHPAAVEAAPAGAPAPAVDRAAASDADAVPEGSLVSTEKPTESQMFDGLPRSADALAAFDRAFQSAPRGEDAAEGVADAGLASAFDAAFRAAPRGEAADEQFDVSPEAAAARESVREALRRVAPDRMAVQYPGRTFSLAREIGRAIRSELGRVGTVPVEASSSIERCRSLVASHAERMSAWKAAQRVAAVYGVALDQKDMDNVVFKALTQVGRDVRSEKAAAFGPIFHAWEHKGIASDTASVASDAVVAAVVGVSSGLSPVEVCAAAEERVDGLLAGVDRTSPLYPTLTRFASILGLVACMDRSGIAEHPLLAADSFDDVISSVQAGLVNRGKEYDVKTGVRTFSLATPGSSANLYSVLNAAEYAPLVGDHRFQEAVSVTLDALYVSKAMVNASRVLGFRQGEPNDAAFLKEVLPEGVPYPQDPVDGIADAHVSFSQLMEPKFDADAASFFDQPSFTTRDPEAWLASVMRPTFGKVSLRDAQMEERRAIAGFHTRVGAQQALDARMYGLDCLPGAAFTAVDPDYESKFRMRAGRTERTGGTAVDAEGRPLYKFFGYAEDKAKDAATGQPIRTDVNGQRLADMRLKAFKAKFQGSNYVITGVNGISFGVSDSADPAYYARERVRERAERGRPGAYSDFDRALLRMLRQFEEDKEQSWLWVTTAEGLGMYDRLVNAACSAIAEAHRLMESPADGEIRLMPSELNHFVLDRLVGAGLVEAHMVRGGAGPEKDDRFVSGVLKLSVDEIDREFLRSGYYRRLLAAGRRPEWLTYEAYAKPYSDLFRDVKRFVDDHPYLSDGDGAFFHNLSTPLPFVQGTGVFMYAANRRAKDTMKEMSEAMDKYEEAFANLVRSERWRRNAADDATDDELRLLRDLFHLRENHPEAIRKAIRDGAYADVRGLRLTAGSDVLSVATAMYDRLVGMSWDRNGDPTVPVKEPGRARMMRIYESARWAERDTVVTGAVGMTDDVAFRVTGRLPHNDQLGHAVARAIDGITTAYAYRAAVFNLMTTPDEDGDPICYVRPADDAERKGGLSDALWGVAARWWCERNGIAYDPAASGVENAQAAYDEIYQARHDGMVKDKKFSELDKNDVDGNSVTGILAMSGVPEGESKAAALTGGYALGYAKHLFQSTRALGPTWMRASIHRVMSYSKSLSVSFSYFFPLATRFESPIGAVGALATLGGNFAPDFVRDHAEFLSRLQGVFRVGKDGGWITKDFLGQRDVFDMMDSNDPYLAELYHWAGCLGLQLSDNDVNPQENAKGQLLKDVKLAVEYTERMLGRKAAKRLHDAMRALLVRSSDRAFNYHLNATKLVVAAQMCQRLQIDAERAGRAFDPVRDLKRYAGYINAEIGGIDPLRYAWTNPKARSFMNALFFSPPWTRGAWEAGGGGVLEQMLLGGRMTTPEERMHFVGRAARMGLVVMFGLPAMLQMASKAFGLLMTAGMDPDDEEYDEERRRMLRMIRDTPWFTWQNEERIGATAYDVTPIMAAVSARCPVIARSRGSFLGKAIGAAPAVAAAVTGKPWVMALSVPVYSGNDPSNRATRGRRYYQHYGKQGWEFMRWFTDPVRQTFSKLSMPVQRLAEGITGRSLSWMDRALPWDDQGAVERWVSPSFDSAWFNLFRSFMPFSMTSLLDSNDAGFVPLLGPVQMGQGATAAIEKLADRLEKWSSDDRRGYAFGGPTRGGKAPRRIAQMNPDVMAVVRDAMANGYSEEAAYALVQTAMSKVTPGVYKRLVDLLPDDPRDDFDSAEVGRLLRQLGRLGKKNKDMYKSIMKRMTNQNRWQNVHPETRRYIRDLMKAAKMDPYGDPAETVRNWEAQMR
ncbi:MAG: hypothetical protein HUJ63_03185, partial [Enterococcus sp.]|nr:hypothetical protein [Enterococcus sp.]